MSSAKSGLTTARGSSLVGPGMADDAWMEFNVRRPSLFRRHGDPFPLPRLGADSASRLHITSPSRMMDQAFGSLNSLALSRADFFETTSGLLPLTDVQRWVMEDISRRVASHGNCPDDLSEEVAVAELGKGANLYNQEAINFNLAEFDLERIKILKRKLHPALARDLAPPEAKGFLDNFDTLIQRPIDELHSLASSGTLVEPYWDPKLKRSLQMRKQLYLALYRSNLLTFVRRRKARIGFFTVKKKDSWIRLILDARQSNECHRKPPTTRLATPAGLTSVDLSHRTLERNGFSAIDEMGHQLPTCFTGDVGDCFYNFVLPAASEWFCTDDIFTVEELEALGMPVSQVFDSSKGGWTPTTPGERLFPAFYGMPMGWSWSLYFANEIINHQCVEHLRHNQLPLIRDRFPAPDVSSGSPAIGVYVDNVFVMGGCCKDAKSTMDSIATRYQQLGIPFEVDQVERETTVEVLGMQFNLDDHVKVTNKGRRTWRLWLAIRAVLRRKRVHGKFLQILVGHINHFFQLCRPALSCMSSIYKFVADHSHHRYPMWPSVRRELKTVMGLLHVIEFDMSAPVMEEVYVGDSSDNGYALMVSEADESEIRREIKLKEIWRFHYSTEPVFPEVELNEDDPVFAGGTADAGFGPRTQFGEQLSERYRAAVGTKQFEAKRKRIFGQDTHPEKSLIEGPGITPVSASLLEPSRWDLLISAAWKDPSEHINVKEAICLMALRRACRTKANLGKVLLVLTDNLVSALVFERGRSSSGPLNMLCRRSSAYQIACGVQMRLRHIPSEKNVLDGPSRRWGADKPVRKTISSCSKHPSDHGDAVEEFNGSRPMAGHVLAHSLEIGRSETVVPTSNVSPSSVGKRGKPVFFLELFSGTARLTKAMKSQGLRVLPDFEVAKGKEFDLLNPHIQRVILDWMKKGKIWMIHLGTPCTVWSRARHNLKNWKKARQSETRGVACALFTAVVIRLALSLGIRFSLENPQSSRLWRFGPIETIFKDKRIHFFSFHLCQYGAAYKKATSIMTNTKEFETLVNICSGGHKHLQLRGSERVKIDGEYVTRNRTAGAGAYPSHLCNDWAQVCRRIAPSDAVGISNWHSCNQLLLDVWDALDAAGMSSDTVFSRGHKPDFEETNPFILFASKYIKTHPVIFGQHSNAEARAIRQRFSKDSATHHSQTKGP